MPDFNEAVDLADLPKQFSNSLSSFNTRWKSSNYAFTSLSEKLVKLKEIFTKQVRFEQLNLHGEQYLETLPPQRFSLFLTLAGFDRISHVNKR